MKRINILMACAALTMAFTGCDDDDPITLVDSGMTTTDSGMTGGDPDAGMTDPDPDAGMTDTCPDVTLPPPDGNVCAQETWDCLIDAQSDGMITQAEAEACITADPMADACQGCLNEEVLACATAMGCASQAGDINCCVQDECGTDEACAQAATSEGGACVPAVNAFIDCANGLALSGTCGNTMLCFPPAGS